MTRIFIWLNRRLARLNQRLENHNLRKTEEGRALLAEQGRQLASLREHLIARGVDPTELASPLHPDDIESEDR